MHCKWLNQCDSRPFEDELFKNTFLQCLKQTDFLQKLQVSYNSFVSLFSEEISYKGKEDQEERVEV